MIFHSTEFIVFLVVVLITYWMLGRRKQNVFLLAASYFFYGYVHTWFLVLILASTLVDYSCGLAIEKYDSRKKVFLTVSIFANLGMLCTFKYFGFFAENVAALFNLAGLPFFNNTINIILPVGISFYTFQTLSYTIDIYRGKLKARRDFIDYALFVAFFPQLVAGPIERASNLLPQIEKPRHFEPAAARDAVYLMMWGFFKKLVVADNVGTICNKIFMLEEPSFPLLWVGAFAFGVQIFTDFSAYTDIARGTSRLLGFDIMKNFNHPYLSTSPADFWRRWHISLSTWFRDYLYIPLGGSRKGSLRTGFNVIFTFFVCGLWHGADWNYIIWGLYHGVLVYLTRIVRNIIPAGLRDSYPLIVIRFVATFFLIQVSWVIFRERDLHYMLKYLTLSPSEVTGSEFMTAAFIFMNVLFYFLPIWLHIFYSQAGGYIFAGRRKWLIVPFKTAVATLLFMGIITMRAENPADFIYFRF